jgi:hypothetical protein
LCGAVKNPIHAWLDFHRILPIPFALLITCEYLMAESCEIGEENGQGADVCNLLEYRLCRFLIFQRGSLKRSKNSAWNGIFKTILCQISLVL